jgi:neutral ceramidase
LPPVLGDFSCQAEKPVFLPHGATDAAIQMFRFGQLVVVGLPWEVTTMSGRRIREQVLNELAPVGVKKVTISGVTNGFGVGYLTTREEYSAQLYAGASVRHGPWTHAVVLQEVLKLARDMREGVESELPAQNLQRIDLAIGMGPIEAPAVSGTPGEVTRQPSITAIAGEVITAEIVAGHPDNDMRLQESFVYVEQLQADGSWLSVFQDRDDQLFYDWKADVPVLLALDFTGVGVTGGYPASSGGKADAIWRSPKNTVAGEYRFRFVGASRQSAAEPIPYEAITDPFILAAASAGTAVCP